jgi:hypothetical protein
VPSLGARDDVFREAIRDAALFQLGRPVLAVPEEVSSQFGKTVVVAWKDSVEAVRAVMAAAPFFAKASFSQSPRATGRPVSRGEGRLSHADWPEGRSGEDRVAVRHDSQDTVA